MNENYNINAEQAVLSSLLYAPERFTEYSKELNKDIFFPIGHKNIYEAMLALNERNLPIEEEFIKKELSKNGNFDENVLIQIMVKTPSNYIVNYIKELQELHIKREIYEATIKFQHGEIDHIKLSSLITKANSLYKKEEESKLPKREYEHLTPFMKSLFYDLKSINEYPDGMVFSVMLASMAGLIGARAKITNTKNITVFPVIWSMIVAPSSLAAKSTLYKFAKECVFGDIQNRYYDEYEEEKINYKTLYKGYMALPKEEKLQTDEPEEPVLKQLIFHAGGTPEAKIKSLHHNPKGGVVFYDEMKSELEKGNSNEEYKALKTSLFDGSVFHKELVKGGTMILRTPILSEVGLITEKWLLDATHKNDIASGYMARYLFSVHPKLDFKPLQIKDIHIDKKKYAEVGEFILDMFEKYDEPVEFRLSKNVVHKYIEWFNAYSSDAFYTETEEEIASSVRLGTYVLKFMLISYIFNNAYKKIDILASDNMLEIPEEYFYEALEIMQIFREGSDKLLSLFDKADKLNYKIDDYVQKLYKKIDKSPNGKIKRSAAVNTRGLNREKIDHLIATGMLISTKIDRTEYLSKP
ncbi:MULTISPECIES: DUF3987 domain-containing protein [Sulfurimonas]|uniref:DUF3987 domain-containing protein n=1 Tax=Sulfurimonas TaxID=202746 RepID=UPI0012650D0E|nr:DUF3987 domain-containing protein [Sulfurimonas indica]